MIVTFRKETSLNNVEYAYNHGMVRNSFWTSSECDPTILYMILIDKSPAGFLMASIETFKNNHKCLTIHMIEIFGNYRGRGTYGKDVIYNIFKKFGVSSIKGEAIANAIPFWYGVGANFSCARNKLQDLYEDGYSCCFTLSKGSFLKEVKSINRCTEVWDY